MQYAIAFDLDTTAMQQAGLTRSEQTRIYQTEIPEALARCGFTAHPQGSLYHTEGEQDGLTSLLQLQSTLQQWAPNLCRFARRVHICPMEKWSDITFLLTQKPAMETPSAEEELQLQEELDLHRTPPEEVP